MSRVPFDAEAILNLANILIETGLTEIEVTEKDSRIRVVRAHPPAALYAAPPAPAPAPAPQTAIIVEAPSAADPAKHPGAVLSPMVGVAYLAPEPDAPPYVAIGQQVTEGQTLLIIEAMKTFNQIKATKSGTVTQILIAPGTPVEYGELLMILES
ncbi:MAG: acetyl-CoA carboxylase biotin carboxyl carrier protein [Acetobacteraceae bacterium]|nr:acetyl-CoA carboxylase biotin carboxyl carrier protein [Acetobacteraceae bacterium]